MHRFFLDPGALSSPSALQPGTILRLPDKVAHQVRVVLHLQIGEQLILLDNSGDEALCTITSSERSGVEVQVQVRRVGKSESPVHIVLCQGLLKSARFEWILEKGTELGVSTFAPILCRRSMSGLEDAGPAKIQRWQRIIQEASEQCGRARLPTLLPIRPLMHALNDIPAGALALMPWEDEHELSLRQALKNSTTFTTPITVVLFIGPEGGLMVEEVHLAQRHGVLPVTLGPRILRAETAALATVANVMYELFQSL
jgi:16S rRNA (uracil1498-N3)-methyltransferase